MGLMGPILLSAPGRMNPRFTPYVYRKRKAEDEDENEDEGCRLTLLPARREYLLPSFQSRRRVKGFAAGATCRYKLV